MSRTNFIFVDFENVHEKDWDRIIGRPVHVTLVLGEQNRHFPVPIVKQLLKCAGQVSLIETKQTGKNAADLVLAKLIGERNGSDPQGYFHIVSKDKGFDALIAHLKEERILAARRLSFSEIPVLMTPDERVFYLKEFLETNSQNRPGRLTALQSQIQVLFGKSLTADEVDQLVTELKKRQFITIDDNGKISYCL